MTSFYTFFSVFFGQLISGRYILITTLFAGYMGGLLNSGGIMLTGMVCLLMSTLLRNLRWTIAIAVFFLAMIFLLIFIEPYLSIHSDLASENNKLFFTINLTWLTTSPIFFLSFFFWQQNQYEEDEKMRLKELEMAKTRLFTNITHEFRTPLSLILGVAEEITTTDQKSNQNLEIIRQNGRRLLRLVNQMLNLAKLDSGVINYYPVQADIVTYIEFITEIFRPLAQQKNVRLEFESTVESLMMDFDPDKIEEIISNLLSNAIRNSMSRGKVKVSITSCDKEDARTIDVKISDRGSGIPVDKLKRIFDRFYQVEETTMHHKEGSGIGLALVKENVKLIGGSIKVDSQINIGTTFIIKLPVTHKAPFNDPYEGRNTTFYSMNAESTQIQQKPHHPDLNEKPLLLIIEDHPEMIHLLTSITESEFNVKTASNGEEGLILAIELIPDIIISDVMMPKMDGIEFLEKIKSDIRTNHIPIIMLTARADIASKIEGLEKGAEAYLTKPFSKKELRVRLKKLLEQRKLLKERYLSFNMAKHTLEGKFLAEDQYVNQVNMILEDHLEDESYGVDELARSMAMSRSQLYRKFHALTDTTVDKYILKFRLHKAMELIKTTDYSIGQIALEVGIPNPAYFSRVFKNEFDVAPSRVMKVAIE